jgi:hypothetical protein
MTAAELFRQCGISKLAYERFLRPTMLISLFAPPEQLSAAVVLETLYFYGKQGTSGLVLKDSALYGKPVLQRSTCESP